MRYYPGAANTHQTSLESYTALGKIVTPRRKRPPWISPDLQLLLDEKDATHHKYRKKERRSIFQKFLKLSELAESKVEATKCAYMNSRVSDSLKENQNVWKKLKNLGLLPSSTSALRGFTPEELISHFLNISISPSEDPNNSLSMVSTAICLFIFKS